MQGLTTPPAMSSPYTPVGGNNMQSSTPNAPTLGTPIPGTTGGLPAKPGLTVFNNPMPTAFQSQPNAPQQSAQRAQSFGRGNDTMLIHMTPEEVGGLQQLALASGGSLTINPHTGLPEAGWLGKLLPTILGGIGMAFGIPPIWLGALGAVGGTAITGDLKQGLLAGLGAFGGASLAGAAGVGGALGHVGQGLGLSGSGAAVMHPTAGTVLGGVAKTAGLPTSTGVGVLNSTGAVPGLGTTIAPGAVSAAPGGGSLLASGISNTANAAKTGLGGILQGFGDSAKAGLSGPIGGTLSKIAVPLATMGAMDSLSNAITPDYSAPAQKKVGPEYRGPYVPQQRTYSFQTPEQMRETGGAEFTYVTPSNPVPGYQSINDLSPEQQKLYGYADGGIVSDAMAARRAQDEQFIQEQNAAIDASRAQAANPAATGLPAGKGGITTPRATEPNGFFDAQGNFTGVGPSGTLGNIPNWTPPTGTPGTNLDGSPAQTFDYGTQTAAPVAPRAPVAPPPAALTAAQFPGAVQTPAGFEDLVSFFRGTSPGAITASMHPQSVASSPAAEKTYSFNRGSGNFGIGAGVGGDAGTTGNYGNATEPYNPAINVINTPNTATPEFDFSKVTTPDYSTGNWGTPDMGASTTATADWSPGNFDFGSVTMPDYSTGNWGTPDMGASTTATDGGGWDSSFNWDSPGYNDTGSTTGDSGGWNNWYDLGYGDTGSSSATNDWGSSGGGSAPGYWEDFMFNRGGKVDIRDGSFVVDARTVSELGNGSSGAGKDILARMGGRPLNGPGDGVSDSIPASIGGTQRARVARDEVIMPPEAVRRIGGGNDKRGTQKLYALMDKAHKARKRAGRGTDTKLARGLGAL